MWGVYFRTLTLSTFFGYLLNGIIGSHLSNSRQATDRSRFPAQFSNNRLTYNAIILELLRRKLNIRPSKQIQPSVQKPMTISLPDGFIQQENTNSVSSSNVGNSGVSDSRVRNTNNLSAQTQPRFPGNNAMSGLRGRKTNRFQTHKPLTSRNNALSGSPRSSAQSQTRFLRNKVTAASNHINSKHISTKTIGKDSKKSNSFQTQSQQRNPKTTIGTSQKRLDNVIALSNKGGFEFQTSSGFRFKLPTKRGNLVINQRSSGLEFNYMPTSLTTTPKYEEEFDWFEF